MTIIETFAEQHRLKVSRDECNDQIIQGRRGHLYFVPYDASKPVDTFWDLGYFDHVAIWLAQSIGFEFASLTSFRGHSRAFSITYASFSPAPTFTVLTTFPGTVVRRLCRQGGAFATRWLPPADA